MNTESQQQIAREAASEQKTITKFVSEPQHTYPVTPDAMGRTGLPVPLAQPQRSEKQEWTNEDSYIYEGFGFSVKSLGRAFDEQDARSIKNAHNAALTAEQSMTRDFEYQMQLRIQDLTAERKLRKDAETEWWAKLQREREALKARDAFAKRLERQNKELNDRLLSALAAIEKIQKIHGNDSITMMIKVKSICRTVDLSLLHEHDRKEQKPLVDALRLIEYDENGHITACMAESKSMGRRAGEDKAMIIQTLTNSLALYELHNRSPYSAMAEIYKRRALLYCIGFTICVTVLVMIWIVYA